jgi:hypothetical protein
MKIKNKLILGMDGVPVKVDGKPLSTAEVFMNCALAPAAAPTPPRQPKDVMNRFEKATYFKSIETDTEFEIDLDTLTWIRDDMVRIYPVLTAGQVLIALEGKN